MQTNIVSETFVEYGIPEISAPMLMKELGLIRTYLDDDTVTEIVINRPGEARVERPSGWTTYKIPEITFKWCKNIGRQIASPFRLSLSDESPFLSARLPTGERVQIIIPPAVNEGTISITIRKPSKVTKSLNSFIEDGMFRKTQLVQSILLTQEERAVLEADLPDNEKKLLKLIRAGQHFEFIDLLVKTYKNIFISGSTGAGKTTLANAIIELLPPEDRIITVEDVAEVKFPDDRNVVSMFYASAGRGKDGVTPKQVFESTLRMRPDRILPAELRGDESFFFIQNVLNSGHPGTITTGHANSAKLLFLRLSLMIKTSPEGSGLSREDILTMLYMLVDCVVQIVRYNNGTREITEIYYDPAFARKQMG